VLKTTGGQALSDAGLSICTRPAYILESSPVSVTLLCWQCF